MKAGIRVLLAVAIVLWVISYPFPAAAAFCRLDRGREICIVEIKRSAKNYREYRASVSIDGATRPIESYDCRQKIRVTREGGIVPLSKDPAGEFLCRFVEKNRYR
jgi:hypothetical protein